MYAAPAVFANRLSREANRATRKAKRYERAERFEEAKAMHEAAWQFRWALEELKLFIYTDD
jgi:hypothetical protein